MRSFATCIALILGALPALTHADDITWVYTGTVTSVSRNTIGVPSPLGLPLEISITFDPDTVVTYPNILFGGRHAMSGGNTNFQIKVGSHASDPVGQFRLDAVTPNCCASNDLYLFRDAVQTGGIRIDLPTYFGDAAAVLRFEERFIPGPIMTHDVPLTQPDPRHFRESVLIINKSVSGTRVLGFSSSNLRLVRPAVPEPASVVTVAAMAVYIVAMRRKRS